MLLRCFRQKQTINKILRLRCISTFCKLLLLNLVFLQTQMECNLHQIVSNIKSELLNTLDSWRFCLLILLKRDLSKSDALSFANWIKI
eukprot:05593.XXX_66533_66796_1 [CDS] Oithona nana genome sequencing.